ncbi:phosphoribosylamidoimidazolesuccinocarboxamide synthase, SAICAR synthetase, Ade7 [Schizosaccharomyces pombe]|uniref:Phosphoribosylaminoimidazole-succinocarboxamide synthase n=1 Tax=Schizosaccharomyces pombe (strain 972 / ATCC 24843) TaxID=284812 RepID=PUR7_SCHPO|nr:phosphoribosylaminoimidazolesuccinocarboxamide synthase [Schizosaccharomyces pombe]Q9UUB4.1 RecName: Full=Phosphoribosylaminoimidazole-succinocarboxamide synthase; AltName: Full=SAICAR synthetase [Schizosaccharomyces pombe 972h-]CAB52612.1 phosphoribosylamidoimidazolesuccinocarboxamide synthase, SAICAR synthetase, Ade7 [Schizosaccharomyces pombe]|eukprot:NP_595460.1 phosphoribosylaminoimidazolesuccinocarboxamide synthase [Schizosaccharomyces pombe]
MALLKTSLDAPFTKIATGKVRDLYECVEFPDDLLFVATDRISAYDFIMENGIPEKGKVLTKISEFWFDVLKPHVQTHLITSRWEELPPVITKHEELKDRSMLVKKYKILPIEAIVRGYITGSAWKEYQKQGTVHGLNVPTGMKEAEAFPEPLFTPSTKAAEGHDENIHPDEVSKIVGPELAKQVAETSVKLYKIARDVALKKGIIIADTKFEFGVDETTNKIVLVDEVLTPDSSRFWLASDYTVGKSPDSFDKQYLRNWLTANNLANKPNVSLPEDVVEATRRKYVEAYEMITGKKWSY